MTAQDCIPLAEGWPEPPLARTVATKAIIHVATEREYFTPHDVRAHLDASGTGNVTKIGPVFQLASASGVCTPTDSAVMRRIGKRMVPQRVWQSNIYGADQRGDNDE